MRTLKEYKGYQLVERYGNLYIRFWGGKDENLPCEFPVSESDAERIIDNEAVFDDLMAHAKKNIIWTADSFIEIGIKEYLIHYAKLSDALVSRVYDKLDCHKDVRDEFYALIMAEK